MDISDFIGAAKTFHVLGIKITKDGDLINEWYSEPECRRNIYSATKSFTSCAVGFAVQEGLLSLDEKLNLVQKFLEDKKVFPTIKDVITFANDKLNLDFKDQKESRNVTISRIIGRIRNNPTLKEKLKLAVLSMRNEKMHNISSSKSKKEIITAETFDKWAEIIRKI